MIRGRPAATGESSNPARLWPFPLSRITVARLVVLGVTYYGTAWISLRVALVGHIVSPIWPPTGIAVVAMLLYGTDLWPAVTLAAVAINAPISPSASAAFLIAIGNTLAPLTAVGLLRAVKFHVELDRIRDALALVVLGALVAMTVSASFGTVALWWGGAIADKDIAGTWSVWWAGDATGLLVFAPLLLSIRGVPRVKGRRAMEALLFLGAVSGTTYFAFRSQSEIYLVFPLLIWGAMRFGQLGASTSALAVVAMAVWAAEDRAGPFAHQSLFHRMATLQIYNAVAALTSFILAAVATERVRALNEVQAGLRRERRITETLQRTLLPERLPVVPGVAMVSRYRPGAAGLDVGGDWYDVFVLPGGQLALTIGDVVGRGLIAAATMGQLRTALRAYALEIHSPASIVERLSKLARELEPAQMATLVYAVLDPATGRLSLESAGHPPPLLISPDGAARYLDVGGAPPLGVTSAAPAIRVMTLEPGSTLLFYTDGLVEPRYGSIEEGMERLRAAASGFRGDLDELCDEQVLSGPRPESPEDDVAVLAVRLLPMPVDRFELVLPAEPEAVGPLRRAVGQWLARLGATRDEINDLVLACNEAGTNVLEHAYGPSGGTLEIEGANTAGDVCIVIRDRGSWRQPRDVGRGRGLQLMRALVDAVDVVTTDQGTEVRLHRRLGSSASSPRQPLDVAQPIAQARDLVPVVRLQGDVDVVNASSLYHELIGALSHDALGLVVDLSDVEHLDSAGVRLIFRVADRLGPRRQSLRVVTPAGSPVRTVLTLSRVDSSAPLTTSVEEAVAEIRVVHDVGSGRW